MNQLKLKITGPVAIGGKRPGEEFEVPVLEDGVTPADQFWRRRLADEAAHNCGAVAIITEPETPADTAAPKALAQASSKKGR